MADFSWVAAVEDLSPPALTVRAQALSPNDQGNLIWDSVFPRRDVNSVNMRDVTTLDYRPSADRREWDARGRRIPMLTPNIRELSMVPIEANDQIGEQEIQALMERTLGGDAGMLRRLIMADIPSRATTLAEADYRRLELDTMQAWTTGTIIQRNPEDASKTYTASFGIDAGRIQTALTDWDDAGVNAYNLLLSWYQTAVDRSGPGLGVMLRRASLNAILADAPNLPNSVSMTLGNLADRIRQDLGMDFNWFINERTVDVFDDGGAAYTRTKIWPAETLAFVPQGGVGITAFAPVVRAMEMAAQVPGAGIDIRGVTVYYDEANMGRQLDIEAQLNAMPIPDESKVDVIAIGV